MVRNILIGGVVALVGLLGFAYTRPDVVHIERSAEMSAPPDVVFAHIEDFHAWERWSPWGDLDPKMKLEYGGATHGPGATYTWAGNADVGKGRMEITTSKAPTAIDIQLDFLEPVEAHNRIHFQLTPNGPTTRVVWSMEAPQDMVSKVAGVFMNLDALIGKDFEKGLTNLTKVSEVAAEEARHKVEEAQKARAAAEAAVAAQEAIRTPPPTP